MHWIGWRSWITSLVVLSAAVQPFAVDSPFSATSPLAAQTVLDRSPNLSGGWVGETGTIHMNLVHRFWLTGSGDNRKLVNSPTMMLGVPLPGRVLAAAQYASNSLVSSSRFNEWELLIRWAVLDGASSPVDLSVTGAYNSAAGSGDGELALAKPVGPVRALAAVRGFTDARGTGEPGWAAAGGLAWHVRDHVAVAGDYGAMWVDGTRSRPVWGAALQLRIPTTPHSLSIQAGNARTATLQGSSVGGRTTWGFEFTAPLTLSRYFPGARPASAAEPLPVASNGNVEVTMTELRFAPEAIEVPVGTTVVWRNTSVLLHTVTADSASVPEGADAFDSGDLMPGDQFEHTFSAPGEYIYVCIPHQAAGMTGRIHVVP